MKVKEVFAICSAFLLFVLVILAKEMPKKQEAVTLEAQKEYYEKQLAWGEMKFLMELYDVPADVASALIWDKPDVRDAVKELKQKVDAKEIKPRKGMERITK